MLKEQLISFFNALTDILYRLRSDLLPKCFTLSQFGNVTLKLIAVQVLTPHPVVPFVKRNAMVINHPGSIDTAFEVFISTALI
jgi:hypothetical protein